MKKYFFALVLALNTGAAMADHIGPGGGHGGGHGHGHPDDDGGVIIIDPDHGGGGGGPIIEDVETRRMHCASGQYRYNECRTGLEIREVVLLQQVSSARCTLGRTYGVHHGRDSIWVDRGCRGNFLVIGVRRHPWH